MAVTAKMFGQFLMTALRKEVNLESDSLKIMLLSSTAALGATQQDTWVYKSHVTNEIDPLTYTGYTAGGTSITVASGNITYATTNIITFKPTSTYVEWTNATIVARYAIVYDDTPSLDSQKPLIGWIDFGADMSSTAGTFRITFDTNGLFTLTVAA